MKDRARKLLRLALNDPGADFRDGQWECIESLLQRRRMLVVQRTGWGKSMVYFLATCMLRDRGVGATLLISPLLALMRNQILAAGRIGVRAYHSNSEDREELEDRLLENRIKALVATVALGMGFDKPDLGFVIHFQRPASVVHYYQQVGRAGRALADAYGILLSGREDDDIADFFIRSAFPPQVHVDAVLAALNEAEDGLSIPMMEKHVNLSFGEISKTIKYLSVESPAPVVKQGTRWYATPVKYEMDRETIDQLCTLRREEQKEMRDYMQSRECLMQFLSRALDDPHASQCGRCAVCVSEPHLPQTVSTDLANAAALFLRRSHQTIAPRKKFPKDAFPKYGFSTTISTDNMAREGRALSLWGDAGWGRMVKEGKFEAGRFSDELVDGCVQMIETWEPEPEPSWATCVPSLNRPELVPDFAARLAERLGIPFIECVQKVKENRPQKEMQNSFMQAANLDGAFEIDESQMPEGPVFLIDDMVDSRWTFTVIAALLREAGCPAVFPLALAMSSPRSG